MKLSIDEKAKEYIRSKTEDNAVTVAIVNNGSGWRPIFEPSVRMGKPRDIGGYKTVAEDGITLFLDRSFKAENNMVEVSLGKFLWKKHLEVSGLSIGR